MTRSRLQVEPPSLVLHSPGPQAQPSRELVNRIWLTPEEGESVHEDQGAGGGLAATQVFPPLVVSRSSNVRHGCCRDAHDGTPSNQPIAGDGKLAAMAENWLPPVAVA